MAISLEANVLFLFGFYFQRKALTLSNLSNFDFSLFLNYFIFKIELYYLG